MIKKYGDIRINKIKTIAMILLVTRFTDPEILSDISNRIK